VYGGTPPDTWTDAENCEPTEMLFGETIMFVMESAGAVTVSGCEPTTYEWFVSVTLIVTVKDPVWDAVHCQLDTFAGAHGEGRPPHEYVYGGAPPVAETAPENDPPSGTELRFREKLEIASGGGAAGTTGLAEPTPLNDTTPRRRIAVTNAAPAQYAGRPRTGRSTIDSPRSFFCVASVYKTPRRTKLTRKATPGEVPCRPPNMFKPPEPLSDR